MTDHACRSCLGPILEQDGRFVCAVCDAEAQGAPDPICGCGLRPRDMCAAPAGFRCAPNPLRSPANPARVIILFGDAPVSLEASHV